MTSAQPSHSHAEVSGSMAMIGVIARLAALIVAIGLISWLLGLSDVGSGAVLLGASAVVLMIGLLGLGRWRALSRAEERGWVDEPQPERPTRLALLRAEQERRRDALMALALAQHAREAASADLRIRTESLELLRRMSERWLRESLSKSEPRLREDWTEFAQSVDEARAELESSRKSRRAHRRRKDELAAETEGNQ